MSKALKSPNLQCMPLQREGIPVDLRDGFVVPAGILEHQGHVRQHVVHGLVDIRLVLLEDLLEVYGLLDDLEGRILLRLVITAQYMLQPHTY